MGLIDNNNNGGFPKRIKERNLSRPYLRSVTTQGFVARAGVEVSDSRRNSVRLSRGDPSDRDVGDRRQQVPPTVAQRSTSGVSPRTLLIKKDSLGLLRGGLDGTFQRDRGGDHRPRVIVVPGGAPCPLAPSRCSAQVRRVRSGGEVSDWTSGRRTTPPGTRTTCSLPDVPHRKPRVALSGRLLQGPLTVRSAGTPGLGGCTHSEVEVPLGRYVQ